MSRWSLLLFNLILVISIASCSSISKMAGPNYDIPLWINGPSLFEQNGYIYAVGSSPATESINLASVTAAAQARETILYFLDSKPLINGQYINNTLIRSEVTAQWRNYETMITYALVIWKIPEK